MILLIEDNDADAVLIRRILEQTVAANNISHVSDGNTALKLLADSSRVRPQLILLNLQLTTPPGMQVLEQLRRNPRSRRIPIVTMSDTDDPATIARSYELGINSAISKSDHAEQFEQTIAHLAPYWLELNQPYPLSGVTC